MVDTLKSVREFHELYGVVINDKPDIMDGKLQDLRINLLQEELDELKDAVKNNDLTGVLDALIDLQYVLDGAFLAFGMHDVKEAAFKEVHRSNMSKMGGDGKPIYREGDGKILKGPNYFRPDMAQFIDNRDVEEAA